MAGIHHYGYTPFQVDIGKYLYFLEKNRIAVTVSNDNEQNSRWYSCGGLYRGAELLVGPKLHIAPNGIYVHTDHFAGEDAFVIVETTVEHHTDKDHCLWVDLTGRTAGKKPWPRVKSRCLCPKEVLRLPEPSCAWKTLNGGIWTTTICIASQRPLRRKQKVGQTAIVALLGGSA